MCAYVHVGWTTTSAAVSCLLLYRIAFIMWIPGLELKSSNIVLAAITAAPQVLRQHLAV